MRCYGFTNHGDVIDDEASHLRAFARLIQEDGATITSVVGYAREHDIRTVTGRPWNKTTLRRVLVNPRLRGPILKAREFDRLRKRLEARVQTNPGRRYLLTGGLARCGLCGAPLESQPSNGAPSYVCRKTEAGGCGRIRIAAEAFEEVVTVQALARLASPANRQRLAPAPGDLAAVPERISDCEDKLVELAQDYADGTIDRAFRDTARDRLHARLREYRELEAQAARVATLLDIDPDALASWWTDAPVPRRRDLLALVLDHVDVLPVEHAGRQASPEARIRPIWR